MVGSYELALFGPIGIVEAVVAVAVLLMIAMAAAVGFAAGYARGVRATTLPRETGSGRAAD